MAFFCFVLVWAFCVCFVLVDISLFLLLLFRSVWILIFVLLCLLGFKNVLFVLGERLFVCLYLFQLFLVCVCFVFVFFLWREGGGGVFAVLSL